MGKAAASAMKYEKMALKPKVRTKLSKQIEMDGLDKFSSFRIVAHLYKRHETALLYIGVAACFYWGFSQAFFK